MQCLGEPAVIAVRRGDAGCLLVHLGQKLERRLSFLVCTEMRHPT